MNEAEYAKIIATNLRRIMYEHHKTQADLARDLHISKATISSWMNGTRIPRMPKIDLLCHYFNISRADLMEKQNESSISSLSPDESSLLAGYKQLNKTGKAKTREYISDLLDNEKYTKNETLDQSGSKRERLA